MNQPLALVIDDEPDIRELLTLTLGRMDIDTESAGDVDGAKNLLGSQQFSSSSDRVCSAWHGWLLSVDLAMTPNEVHQVLLLESKAVTLEEGLAPLAEEHAHTAVIAARVANADLIVAVGGGSVVDATKVVQLCLWKSITTVDHLSKFAAGFDRRR